jgi:hypothetical protein
MPNIYPLHPINSASQFHSPHLPSFSPYPFLFHTLFLSALRPIIIYFSVTNIFSFLRVLCALCGKTSFSSLSAFAPLRETLYLIRAIRGLHHFFPSPLILSLISVLLCALWFKLFFFLLFAPLRLRGTPS